MDHEPVRYTVCAKVSSKDDEQLWALWTDMIDRIKEIVKDPKYKSIDPW